MTDTRLTKAEQLVIDALELDAEARAALLDDRCGNDTALRAEVERLLAAADASEDYFGALPERLGIEKLRRGTAKTDEARKGNLFGPYRLIRRIGRGGMGTVWRAERTDGRFEGEVAVKLLTRTESSAALQHFDREAHYLAKLTHPNIARLIDAGVGPDETPYLILEHVEGEEIDRWCDAKALRPEARLRLFLQVVDAVAHAHARLVVHNDIKPSNVLVTPDGMVKLLDFGIATLLDGDEHSPSGYAFTPEFASPEQIAGETVSTATDTYSLGVLLHTLLTGSSPRQLDAVTNLDELKREVTKDPPPLISTLTGTNPEGADLRKLAAERGLSPGRFIKTLRGDLDPIVRMALAVDPEARYRSVSDLATDLNRYLKTEPVSAVPNTLAYRAGKFFQRHRGGVLTGTLTALALIAAVVVTTWQSVEAKRQRDIAIWRDERVLATNDFLNLLLGELGRNRELPSLEALLDRGVEIIETRYGESERTTAITFYELSVLYGRLGLVEKQLATLNRSEAVASATGEDGTLAMALCAKARLTVEQDPTAAAAYLAAGQAALERLPSARRDGTPECFKARALTHSVNGDHDAAIATYQEMLAIMDEAPVISPALRLSFLNDLAEQYFIIGQAGEALDVLEEIIRFNGEHGRGTTIQHLIYLANRAAVLTRLGEVARAADQHVAIMVQIENMEQAPVGMRSLYAATLERLARYEEAKALLETDYAAAEAAGNDRRRGIAALQLGEVAYHLDDQEGMAAFLGEAAEVFSASPGAYPRELVRLELLEARVRFDSGDTDGARDEVDSILARLGYPGDLTGIGLAGALWHAAELALATDDPAAALTFADAQLSIATEEARDPDQSADLGRASYQRARANLALGRPDAAAADLRQANVSLSNGYGAGHPDTTAAAALLVQLSQ